MLRQLGFAFSIFLLLPCQGQPGPEIQALYAILGDWGVTTFEIGEDGRWKPGMASIARITSSLDGNFIEEEAILRGPFSVSTVKRIYAFDSRKRRFRVIEMEKESGLMNVYHGVMNAGSLESDNILDVATKNRFGLPFHYQFRLSVKDENEILININQSGDRGATWKGHKMIKYTRIH